MSRTEHKVPDGWHKGDLRRKKNTWAGVLSRLKNRLIRREGKRIREH